MMIINFSQLEINDFLVINEKTKSIFQPGIKTNFSGHKDGKQNDGIK
jgi:hypothetical protein